MSSRHHFASGLSLSLSLSLALPRSLSLALPGGGEHGLLRDGRLLAALCHARQKRRHVRVPLRRADRSGEVASARPAERADVPEMAGTTPAVTLGARQRSVRVHYECWTWKA